MPTGTFKQLLAKNRQLHAWHYALLLTWHSSSFYLRDIAKFKIKHHQASINFSHSPSSHQLHSPPPSSLKFSSFRAWNFLLPASSNICFLQFTSNPSCAAVSIPFPSATARKLARVIRFSVSRMKGNCELDIHITHRNFNSLYLEALFLSFPFTPCQYYHLQSGKI